MRTPEEERRIVATRAGHAVASCIRSLPRKLTDAEARTIGEAAIQSIMSDIRTSKEQRK